MSAPRKAGVYVHPEDGGPAVYYGPEDDVAPEHQGLLGGHLFADGVNPYVEQAGPRTVPEDGGSGPAPAQRPDAGASRGEWDAFAKDTHGIDAESLPNKQEVINAVNAAEAKAGNGPVTTPGPRTVPEG